MMLHRRDEHFLGEIEEGALERTDDRYGVFDEEVHRIKQFWVDVDLTAVLHRDTSRERQDRLLSFFPVNDDLEAIEPGQIVGPVGGVLLRRLRSIPGPIRRRRLPGFLWIEEAVPPS